MNQFLYHESRRKSTNRERTEKEIHDEDGHAISAGDLYLRGKYLKQERTRSHHLKQFSIYPDDVTCEPSEVFKVFVEVSDGHEQNVWLKQLVYYQMSLS